MGFESHYQFSFCLIQQHWSDSPRKASANFALHHSFMIGRLMPASCFFRAPIFICVPLFPSFFQCSRALQFANASNARVLLSRRLHSCVPKWSLVAGGVPQFPLCSPVSPLCWRSNLVVAHCRDLCAPVSPRGPQCSLMFFNGS